MFLNRSRFIQRDATRWQHGNNLRNQPKRSKMGNGLKLWFRSAQLSSLEWELCEVVERMMIGTLLLLSSLKSEPNPLREIEGWKCLSSGHDLNARLNGGVAFLVRADMKVGCNSMSSRIAYLALQPGVEHYWFPGKLCPHWSQRKQQSNWIILSTSGKNLQGPVRPLSTNHDS